MIPEAALYRFLETYAAPASELPSSDNGYENAVCHIRALIALTHANINSDSR